MPAFILSVKLLAFKVVSSNLCPELLVTHTFSNNEVDAEGESLG